MSYITYKDYIYFPNVTSKVLAKGRNTLYPEQGRKLCAAIVMTNLADPEWITINCNEKLTTDVMCYFEQLKIPPSIADLSNLTATNPDCIIKNDICFVFHWVKNHNKNHNKNQNYIPLKYLSDIQLFTFLFDAVSVTISPILYCNYKYKTTYQKYAEFYDFKVEETNENSEGFVISKFNKVSFLISVGLNVFKCGKNVSISITLVCNGYNDCPGQEALDETGCQCDSQDSDLTQCRSKITQNVRNICSFFYLQTVNNSCHIYDNIYNFITDKQTKYKNTSPHDSCMYNRYSFTVYSNLKCHLLEEIQNKLNLLVDAKTYKCSNGVMIAFSMVNDLVPDCGSDADDEKLLKNIKQNMIYKCSNKNQIPCRIGHPRCFNISDICTFRLNEMNHLIPCRTGEHLQNCTDFECNMLFKCPSSHCIPWGYVCDSKWDCPSGSDEHEHICGSNRQCHNLYKCMQSQLCIHLNDICNSIADCPYKDDEKYCSLNKIVCPWNCKCLTFTVQCKKLNLTVYEFWESLPFHVISIRESLNYITIHFLKFFPFVSILTLVKNELEVFCDKLPSLMYCFVIDISFNNIKMIGSYCFRNAYFLEVVKLNNNKISAIFHSAFVNLTSLHLLDLSHNMLKIFTSKILVNSNVKELSLLNNNIKDAEFNLQLDVLRTNDYHLCCLMSTKTQCSAEMPWYISCANFLVNLNIKVCLYFLSSCIILLNIFTLIYLIIFRTRQLSAFHIIVMPISITDIMYSFILLILCVTDSYFHENFIMHELEWKTSSLCLSIFTTVLYFNLFSSFLLSFLSLQRYMIVIYPLRTKFKQIKFVKICICLAFMTTFSFSLAIALFTRNYYKAIPFHLCFPFLDPSKSVLTINILTWMTFLIHICGIFFTLSVYILTVKAMYATEVYLNISSSKKKSYSVINIQVIVFATSNIICWITAGIINITCMFLEKYSIEMVIWTVAAISPINSLINPVMFISMKLRE